jgi:hypothetical protein
MAHVPDRIQFSGVTVNAPDALALARFYADITGGDVNGSSGTGHPFCLSTWSEPQLD